MLFAHRDAAAFRRYVLNVLGFDPANVNYLQDATQAQMTGVFGNAQDARGKPWFYLDPDEGGKLSDVVVFYSGHGMPGLNEKTPGAYLLPADANPTNPRLNGYSVDLLYRNLGKLPARTVPANARVRVFTSTGSSYREGMVLTRGQYELAVEAAQHEPFRRHLTVEGPTAYGISLQAGNRDKTDLQQ